MDFQLTTEQSLLKARAREFARQMIVPKAAHYDREACFPWEIFRGAQEQSLLHLTIPPAYGGKGLGVFEQVLVGEELAWGCTGICAAISLNSLAISALLLAGTPAQQRSYLPRLLAGELCSFAVTEPEAGSDIGAIQTTALRTEHGAGDSYILNGRKTWISNAPEANFFIIFAKTSPPEGYRGISTFIIERTTPGVVIGPPLGKLGQRATPTAEIVLQDVQVPRAALLGSQDYGFGIAMQVFDRSRPLVAAYGVGLAQRCLDEALAYACNRRTMGKPIIEHQAIGNKIAEMGMRLEAARLLTYQAAWLLDARDPNTLQVAYAKAFAADTAMWAASEAVQIFGGAGYSTDLPLEKLFRDAKLLQIYEGTSEIQRLIMTNELARVPLLSTTRQAPVPVRRDANTADLPRTSIVHGQKMEYTANVHTNTTDSPRTSIEQLFEEQVERTPDRVALVFAEEQLTYAALNRRANQLAHHLQGLGVGPEVVVGICMERSLELVIGILGILKAGGAYVFLDPTYPSERMAFMRQDAQVKLLLTQQRLVEKVLDQHVPAICLDSDWEVLEQEATAHLRSGVTQRDLAYVMYTSGSTGLPKGVMIEHAGLSNMVEEQIRLFGIQSQHRIAQFAPFSFDASVSELFMALLAGAQLYLIPQEWRWPIPALLQYLQEYAITTMTLPPSVLAILPPEELPILQTIISAGEDISSEIAARWLAGREVFNAYGPTETTVCATLGRCHEQMSHPPIGHPLANTQVYLLDALFQPVPSGVVAEVYIGGIGLARGYLNRPDLTAEKFLPDPFSSRPGARLYKTGDLARYRPDGSIECLGRIDHQVKIHGQRIELGEIEATLTRHPAIRECAVLGREVDGGKRLLAYIVSQEPVAPSGKDLRAFLQQTLPDYMLPAAFITVDSLPLTPNGKLDRQALLTHALPSLDDGRAYAAPRTSLEEELAGILAKLLGVPQVGRNDEFIELGSDSLLLTRLLTRVQEAFQVTLAPRSVYDFPTVATLAQHIERCQQGGGERPDIPIVSISHDGPLPLSFSQQRLWFLDQLNPGSTSYGVYGVFQFQGHLRTPILEQSLQEIVRRHETLRTTIQVQEGQPVLSIAPNLEVTLHPISLRHLPSEEQELAVQQYILQEVQQSFDLAQGPLVRFTLLCLQEDKHVFMVSIHHIIADGWSMDIFYQELAALYDAFGRREPSPLPDLPVQFVDFACWQRQWLQGEILERELAYWKQKLNGVPALLALPTDRPRPAVQTEHGAHYNFLFPLALQQQLKVFSQQEHTTLFMTLLAAFNVLLYRYTGQEDLVVGTPIASRTSKTIEPLIGFFANTLALRTVLSGSLSFCELLRRVREVTLEAYTHQDIRFEQLVDALQLERNTSYSPLVQVMFALQHQQMFTLELSGLTISPLPFESGTAKFDLTLEVVETDAGLSGSLEYNTDLFERERIERMVGHLQQLLEGIVTNPEQRVGELELLTGRERWQIVQEWNRTEVAYPHEQSIPALFEAQVERTPGAIAVVWEHEQLTYAELNQRANQVAWYLRKLGVGPEVRVGLCMQHSLEMVIGLLGILKAGGAYVPFDPAYPQGRLMYMLESSQVAVVLLQHCFSEKFVECKAHVVSIDTEVNIIAQESSENLVHGVLPDNLMYVIYTSGSTGRPKGAGVYHHSFINLLHWFITEFSITHRDRFLLISSINFDLTQKNIFAPLLIGGTLSLLKRDYYDPAVICRSIADERATIINCTPSAFYPLVDENNKSLYKNLSTLRYVFLGGEPIHMPRLRQWMNSTYCNAEIVNTYGPTECTDVCSFYRLDSSNKQLAEAAPPIGKPIFNTKLLILDDSLHLMPVGIAGELYVGGDSVGRGYTEDSELTARKFIPDPFGDIPGARLYRTGDLARYLPDGMIEYLGRIDHQVKLRGFRIELGEIEAALVQHPAVQESVVDVRINQAGDKRLIAYIVPNLNYQPVETLTSELENEYIAQWQMLYEETYRATSTLPDPTFNIIGWNSSYTGKPLAPAEMHEQIEQTVERILALHPTSVFEIGCGTGLLLFRIAPSCSSYRASDFSSEALHYVERLLPALKLSQVTLDQRLAHDFSGIAEESFDVVILNSIVQYFPDIDYLLQTLTGALRVLKPGGSIFIGDIRSGPLLKAYAASVEFFQTAPSCTKEELRQRVHKRIYGEEELLIDPQFFTDVREYLPQITNVRIQLRRGHAHNELTRFRYDVIVTRGIVEDEQRKEDELYWHKQTWEEHSIKRILQEMNADDVQLKHVPNARLMTEARVLSWLSSEDGPATVGALKEALREQDEIWVDPEELWSLGDRLGYTTYVSWSETGSVTDCDVLFKRTPTTMPSSQIDETSLGVESHKPQLRSWKSYANNPLQGKVARKIIPQLRQSLTEQLPEYMLPAAFVSLEQLPLTPNGKVDRRALPDPDAVKSEMNSVFVAPRNPVEEVLASIWCDLLDLQRIGIHENFFALGGHSLLATQLMFRVNQDFQVNLPLQSVFEHPTLAEFAQALLTYETIPGKLTRIAQLRQKILAMSESERQALLASKRKRAVK